MKRMNELTPEEQEARRKYNRERKQQSREKQKAAATPTSDEWRDQFYGSPQCEEVRLYAQRQYKQIAQELCVESGHPARYEIDAVLWTLYGFKKNFVREVVEPRGIKVCFLYPDVIGSQIVAATHRHELEKSGTYSAAYRELLHVLDKRYGRNADVNHPDKVEREAALAVKREIKRLFPEEEQSS